VFNRLKAAVKLSGAVLCTFSCRRFAEIFNYGNCLEIIYPQANKMAEGKTPNRTKYTELRGLVDKYSLTLFAPQLPKYG
jgi:hypothetical protein